MLATMMATALDATAVSPTASAMAAWSLIVLPWITTSPLEGNQLDDPVLKGQARPLLAGVPDGDPQEPGQQHQEQARPVHQPGCLRGQENDKHISCVSSPWSGIPSAG